MYVGANITRDIDWSWRKYTINKNYDVIKLLRVHLADISTEAGSASGEYEYNSSCPLSCHF